MGHRKLKLALVAATAMTVAMPLLASPAFADYAPSSNDAVGVGSDTVQYAMDFLSDGDALGDAGYNTAGQVNKIVDFDATPDANARLAYGNPGVGTGSCPPGLGGTAGTGNQTTSHTDQPCTLNPTIVLRAGLQPVQRPNGSGAGGAAGEADTHHYIDFVRASSAQGSTLQGGSPSVTWDSITLGQDPLAMLETTTPTSNAVPLSTAQLNAIYSCTDTTWTQVGGTSSDTIIPVIPQVGSGTRKSFLANIGNPTLGPCVQTGEENDPYALAAQARPQDAIEPMSGGRLNLFKGIYGAGGSTGLPYFTDPSCPVEATSPAPACTTGKTLNPTVQQILTGTPSDNGALYDVNRPLYVYFRDTDINSSKIFEPGGTLNFVRAVLYNPCPGVNGNTAQCVTIGGVQYGPGGQPYMASSAGQGLISASGINPSYIFTHAGP